MLKTTLIATCAALALTACGSGTLPVDPEPTDPVVIPEDPVTPPSDDPITPPTDDVRPTIINVPEPFSGIRSGWDRKIVNTTVQKNTVIKDAKNLNGAFRVQCGVSYTVRTDPLLNRDESNPMSHMHTYFGGDVPTDANTDLPDLTADGTGSTCAGGTLNRSLYWIPTMIRPENNGEYSVVEPTNFLAYYKNSLNVYGKTDEVIFSQNSGVDPKTLIRRAMPEFLPAAWYNLKMISYPYQGDQRVEKGNNTQWECPKAGGGTNRVNGFMPLDCAPNSTLRVQMWFPQCLNTKKQPRGDESTEAQYYTADGQLDWLRFAENRLNEDGCPSDTAQDEWVRIPTLSYAIFYKVGPTGNSDWILSSDLMMGDGRPGNSMHGDFMNGWDPQAASAWYKDCLLNNKSCTNFYNDLGSGRWTRMNGSTEDLFGN